MTLLLFCVTIPLKGCNTMNKSVIKRLVSCFFSSLMIFCMTISLCACNYVVSEDIVENMFYRNASYDSDGRYVFREENNLGTVSIIYLFSYNPTEKLYHCCILKTINTNVKVFDYAAITFSWNKFSKAYFSAYHELYNVAKIDFEFSNISLESNNIGRSYSYKVLNNSFINLTDKSDIEEYANNSYECLLRLVPYMRRVFSYYGITTDLW